MIRTIENIKTTAIDAKLSAARIARACDPPLPGATVWRILRGRRAGTYETVANISGAIDRLVAEPTAAPMKEV